MIEEIKNNTKAYLSDLEEDIKRFNFASPYVELPKKLTVKQNLEIYGRLYGVGNLKNRITSGEWLVRDVLHVDESTREIFLSKNE